MITNDDKRLAAKIRQLGSKEILKRLGDAGSVPASCSRTRVAGRKPDAPLIPTAASPFPDQAEAQLELLEKQADQHEQLSVLFEKHDLPGLKNFNEGRAAGMRSVIACQRELLRKFSADAQSDTEEVEECPACKAIQRESMGMRSTCGKCLDEEERTRGKRTERSGSGNARDESPNEARNERNEG